MSYDEVELVGALCKLHEANDAALVALDKANQTIKKMLLDIDDLVYDGDIVGLAYTK